MDSMFLTDERLVVTSEPAQSLEQLIKKGNFTHVNRLISCEQFPPADDAAAGEEVIQIAAVRRGFELNTGDALEWLRSKRLRPVGVRELLAIAMTFATTRFHLTLYALGSPLKMADGADGYVSCSLRSERILRLTSIRWEPWWFAGRGGFPCVAQP